MSEEPCTACQRRTTDENLALAEIREILGSRADLPPQVLALKKRAAKVDELADFRLQVRQLAAHVDKNADRLTVRQVGLGLLAILSGLDPEL